MITKRALVAWMLVAVAAVTGLAYWDEQREAAAALQDFADEQSMLALALSRALSERLAILERESLESRNGGGAGVTADAMTRLRASVKALDRPGSVRILLRAPGGAAWIAAADASTTVAPPVTAAVARGDRSVTLTRAEAAELGLPARMAMAGLARVDAGALGAWDVAVVASAKSERDRERRAQWRLLLGVGTVALLVLALGSAALRRGHALALSAVENARDERLVAADKLATMAALATGIAHEVATPLGVIVARAEQIAKREPDSKPAAVILAQAGRIDEVIRGFLALARGQTPRLEDAEPPALAREATDLVEHRFAKASVSLTSSVDDALPRVACDRRLFEQVLVNLLLNACDACQAGGHVELAVSKKNDRVAFVVTDDGAGIREGDAARAKEPFFTTKPEGTGLGLAIANEIVNHHRGTLVLEPRKGARGTVASVELPAAGGEHG